ncbi:hypothetical protein AWC38_SpisGene7637 [Stylophora pistillata]|uniref:EF-hand domain-containing protein n=1 Tax=Stylophora pistillata TaxID=50429 RepID=A0A2B4SE82_STYPI|nr:hypothetical protein AWC38_SpisGene7637 [Stylophora pistillata]
MNPNKVPLGWIIRVPVPRLDVKVLCQDLLLFIFNLTMSGDENNLLVNNVKKVRVCRLIVTFVGEMVHDTNGYDIFKLYEDLFLTENERASMFREGIQYDDLSKIRRNAGDHEDDLRSMRDNNLQGSGLRLGNTKERAVRKIMDSHEWTSGHLLAHVHQKWALAEMVQLECLVNGANGIWASLCEEGAALGHACSTVTLMNLVRMGNKKVLKRYNCNELRDAAYNVTKITTNFPPHPKQVIYGERALDLAFDFGSIAGGTIGKTDFDLANFFGVEAPVRITPLSSESMILDRLIELLGEDPQFTMEMASKMKGQMAKDLAEGKKLEYTSATGLSGLFDTSGGKLTTEMEEICKKVDSDSEYAIKLFKDVRQIWDKWDLEDDKQNDDQLMFSTFYNGFMAPYFGCFMCPDTQKALQAINMDNDGYIDWNEFLFYLKWAMHQYPDIKDVDELLRKAFTMGIIPAMRDEVLGLNGEASQGKN